MELSEEARNNAKATMDAYIEAIENSESRVTGTMQKALSGAAKLLQYDENDGNKKKKKNNDKLDGNATGTTYAEDIFIAGEEGPELIVGHQGATVYTANQTRNILNPYNNSAPEAPATTREITTENSSFEKTVTLRLDGIGEIKLSDGNSKGITSDQVVDILAENLKPILINIVNGEVFEEAEKDYEF